MAIDSRLNANLGLDALSAFERQALDGRQAQLEPGAPGLEAPATAELQFEGLLRQPAVDDGERVLGAPAWDGEDERLLAAGDFQLDGLDRAGDLEQGIEGMVEPLG